MQKSLLDINCQARVLDSGPTKSLFIYGIGSRVVKNFKNTSLTPEEGPSCSPNKGKFDEKLTCCVLNSECVLSLSL